MVFLVGLPAASFVGLWSVLVGETGGEGRTPQPAVAALLMAASFWGAYLAVMNEILSLIHGLTLAGISLGWLLLALAIGWLAWKRKAIPRARRELHGLLARSWSTADLVFLSAVGLEVAVLLVIAAASAPNTTDGLRYHLARVVHWQQDASLAHYPSVYYPQLWNAIWAEEAVLHGLIYFGAAQAANLVQWCAMLGSLAGVVAVTGLLGVRRRGAQLAVAFLASLPSGILEATSTQIDYVVAFWTVAFAYFAVLAHLRRLTRLELTAAAFTLGLGMLTKGTFYPFAAPLLIWLTISLLRRHGVGKAFGRAAFVASLAVVLNMGYWSRNIQTFGGPFGSQQWMEEKTSAVPTLSSVVARTTEEVVLNFPTPSESANTRIVDMEHRFEAMLGRTQAPFTLIWSWNHEDLAGNPLHLTLILLTLIALVWWSRRRGVFQERSAILVLMACASAGFILYAWMIVFEVYNVRYQVPFFALWAPLFGAAASTLMPRKARWGAIMVLLVLGLPWILFNQTRPLIGWQPRTRTASVLVAPQDRVLFSNVYQDRVPYEQAAAVVKQSSCQKIGLSIDSHGIEYVWWWLLGAPAQDIRIEVVDPLSATQRYVDPSFRPCAVICTTCGDRQTLNALPLVGRFEDVSVFLGASTDSKP